MIGQSRAKSGADGQLDAGRKARIVTLIGTDPEIKALDRLLQTAPGVGPIVSAR